jgi:hypothetical protein
MFLYTYYIHVTPVTGTNMLIWKTGAICCRGRESGVGGGAAEGSREGEGSGRGGGAGGAQLFDNKNSCDQRFLSLSFLL